MQKLANNINPTTPQSLRQEYFALKKKHKKLVKRMYKRYKNQLSNEIHLEFQPQRHIWKLINKIRKNETID